MPLVGKKHFAYTSKGMAKAKAYAKSKGLKLKYGLTCKICKKWVVAKYAKNGLAQHTQSIGGRSRMVSWGKNELEGGKRATSWGKHKTLKTKRKKPRRRKR